MKKFDFLVGWMVAVCLMAGCTDEWIVEDTTGQNEGTPFVIYASSEQKPASRLTFDEDGLTMLWENGDQLVLVDVNDKIDPIYLTTELDEPSSTAVFKSESGVPAGTYYIRNYHDGHRGFYDYEGWMTLDLGYEYTNSYDDQYNLDDLSKTGKCAELYAGPITIEDGQTHIDVELKHMFAMLKFNITGVTGTEFSGMNIYIGMVSPQKPFPTKVWLDKDNTQEEKNSTPQLQFNPFYAGSSVSGKGAFILPTDLTGQKVYFYVAASTNVFDAEKKEIIYEIVKDGKELKAGTSYTINLDLSNVTPVEIDNMEISTADQFRALAYNCRLGSGSYGDKYKIMNDIDFEGKNMFPIILNGTIDGQGHKLSNITIDWPYDNAGVFGYMASGRSISNLTLENITVKGKNCVGGLIGGGRADALNCQIIGKNTIIGTGDYVGGLYGGNTDTSTYSGTIEACSVSSETTVEGRTAVGGIAGCVNEILNCESAAAVVKGESKVGGIVGIMQIQIKESSSTASVTATGDYAGGLIGTFEGTYYNSVNQCSYEGGTVSGNNYVGGIIGASSNDKLLDLCYSTGIVKGNAYVGGISGRGFSIRNCYSLCTIESTDQNTTAGITGESFNKTPQNCYFAGTLTNGGYGITGNGTVTACLTTASTLSNADTEEDAAYTSLESIVNMLSHINGENVYSTSKTWEGFANECPLFLWQIPSISIGDENDEVVAPPFWEEEW